MKWRVHNAGNDYYISADQASVDERGVLHLTDRESIGAGYRYTTKANFAPGKWDNFILWDQDDD